MMYGAGRVMESLLLGVMLAKAHHPRISPPQIQQPRTVKAPGGLTIRRMKQREAYRQISEDVGPMLYIILWEEMKMSPSPELHLIGIGTRVFIYPPIAFPSQTHLAELRKKKKKGWRTSLMPFSATTSQGFARDLPWIVASRFPIALAE